jgi:hypothetical protein
LKAANDSRRIKRETAWGRHRSEAIAAAPLIGPNDAPVNILGGYKFPSAPAIDIGPLPVTAPCIDKPSPTVGYPIDDDSLEIPDFLRR